MILVLDELPQIFARPGSERAKSEEALIATLYQQIGQLKVELNFLKNHAQMDGTFASMEKNQVSPIEQKRLLVEPDHPHILIVRQCELLGLARSSYYYEPVPISEEDLLLMRLLDEQYTHTPFYRKRKMAIFLAEHGGQDHFLRHLPFENILSKISAFL